MLSAARSLLFNAVLAERVSDQTWNRLSAGDVANLDGRGSVFAVESVDAELERRCAMLEVHPTAPLAGVGESLARGEVRAREEAVAAQFPEALAVIQAEGMKPERRALRIRVRDLAHEYAEGTLRLRFALGALSGIKVSYRSQPPVLSRDYAHFLKVFREKYGKPQVDAARPPANCATALGECLAAGEKVKAVVWAWARGSLELEPVWRDEQAQIELRYLEEDVPGP